MGTTRTPADSIRLAHEAANRAMALDPKYPWPYAILAGAATSYDNDLKSAAAYLERALVLAPDDLDLLLPAATLIRTSDGSAKRSPSANTSCGAIPSTRLCSSTSVTHL